MIASKADIVNGQIVTSNIKIIKQSELTSDCWGIQIWGLEECKKCELLNTRNCGGKQIRKKLLAKG